MEQQRSSALGRGLDTLLPVQGARVIQATLSSVRPSRHQARLQMNAARLEELAESIRRHGILQPLVVTEEHDDSGTWYELVAGERRWRAAEVAGLDTVPVIVRTADDVSRLQMGLVENLQRENLGAVERAKAYSSLTTEFGMTQDEVARAVGKSRSSVANTLRLLELPAEAREALEQRLISEGHARALLAVRDSGRQTQLLRTILGSGMTVREAERAAKMQGLAADPAENIEREELEARLRSKFGTKVQLVGSRGSGRVMIHYFSEEELEALIHILLDDDVVSRETSTAVPGRGDFGTSA
jgi:ParB family chromosome partitioning protein